MNQMVLLSIFIHFALIGILPAMPFFLKSKKTTYTPVYTVNLVSLPQSKKTSQPVKKKPMIEPVKKPPKLAEKKPMIEPVKKPSLPVKKPPPMKPVELLTKKKESIALAKLKTLEKDLEEVKPIEKNEDLFKEKDIPEMLAALNKIDSDENESGLLDDKKETKSKILEELDKLEKEWDEKKEKPEDIEKLEKSKSLEQLEKLEQKWDEENRKSQADSERTPEIDELDINEVLDKLTEKYTPVSSQNINEIPSYLSIYFSVIRNKIRSNWENPSGVELLSEVETNKKTIVSFNILRSGRLEGYKIQNASGNQALDDLAMSAVEKADPLPPLPSDYHEDFLKVILDFNYSLK